MLAVLLLAAGASAISIHGREANPKLDPNGHAIRDPFHEEDGPQAGPFHEEPPSEDAVRRLEEERAAIRADVPLALVETEHEAASVFAQLTETRVGAGVRAAVLSTLGYMHDKAIEHPEPALFGAAVVLGLLASSCCILQILVNGMALVGLCSAGCVGFRAALEPYQPYMRALTLGLLGYAWVYTALYGAEDMADMSDMSEMSFFTSMPVHCLARQTALCLFLMFTPEMAAWLAGRAGVRVEGEVRRHLRIGGVKCEACALAAKGVLERAGGVAKASVAYPSGAAEVLIAADRSKDYSLVQIKEDLEEYGFTLEFAKDADVGPQNRCLEGTLS